MHIDLLEYELKYKRDFHVTELINEYKLLEEMTACNEKSESDMHDKIESLESRVRKLGSEKEVIHDKIKQSISQLEQIRNGFTKAEMIEAITEITQEMEGYADD